jgi:isopenicillin N synthase-like dioxygenase
MTSSLYVAATHRVLTNTSGLYRQSVVYFFSPTLDARIKPLDIDTEMRDDVRRYWRELGGEKARGEIRSAVKKGDLHHEEFGQVSIVDSFSLSLRSSLISPRLR